MDHQINDIHDYEVNNLISKLIRFVGRDNLEKKISKYKKSLQNSSPLYREYYLKHRHPWWQAFVEYYSIQQAGKSVKRHLTNSLKYLAGDAKKISILQGDMPEPIKKKFKIDLLDDDRAIDYLYELNIAWHFFLKGFAIIWKNDQLSSNFEFTAQAKGLSFNVECKRITVNLARKIKRDDLYRFYDSLIPKIEAMNYSGKLSIILNGKLPKNLPEQEKIANDISTLIATKGGIHEHIKFDWGELSTALKKANGEYVDLNERYGQIMKTKPPQSHIVIFSQSKNNRPINAIEVLIESKMADNILDAIYKKLSKSGKKQLPTDQIGFISCFLEDVYNLEELATDSGLQLMTSQLLNKDSFDHIAAISYSSETLEEAPCHHSNNMVSSKFFSQGLLFRNQNCKFKEAQQFLYHNNKIIQRHKCRTNKGLVTVPRHEARY